MPDSPIQTPSQTSGPLFGFALLFEGSQNAVDPQDPRAIQVEGQVIDGGGPLVYPDCFLEAWQGDLFARTRTDGEGRFRIVVRKPERVPTPDGELQAPFLNVTVFARGLLKQAQTRMYFPDEAAANSEDPVLALVPAEDRETLIAVADGEGLRFDIRLQGDRETVFFSF